MKKTRRKKRETLYNIGNKYILYFILSVVISFIITKPLIRGYEKTFITNIDSLITRTYVLSGSFLYFISIGALFIYFLSRENNNYAIKYHTKSYDAIDKMIINELYMDNLSTQIATSFYMVNMLSLLIPSSLVIVISMLNVVSINEKMFLIIMISGFIISKLVFYITFNRKVNKNAYKAHIKLIKPIIEIEY